MALYSTASIIVDSTRLCKNHDIIGIHLMDGFLVQAVSAFYGDNVVDCVLKFITEGIQIFSLFCDRKTLLKERFDKF